MTNSATNKLYQIIAADMLRKYGIDTSKEAIEACLRDNADLFASVGEGADRCFTSVVRYQKTRIIRIILEYYKKHDIKIDFTQMALDEKTNYKINLLQYVFKYGNEETFDKCCALIGNHDEIKRILNAPIDQTRFDKAGEEIYHTASIWEDTLLAVNLQKLIMDPAGTLNEKKYDKETKKYLTSFFEKWRFFSSKFSDNPKEPNLQGDWKAFAETHNKKHPDNQLPLTNPLLSDRIEFILDPANQFMVAISKDYIDLDYISPYSNLNFRELVGLLSTPSSDPINVESWENFIPALLSRYVDNLYVRMSYETDETPTQLRSTAAEFVATLGFPVAEPVHAQIIFDFRPINALLANALTASSEDEIRVRLRKHSLTMKEQQQNIDKLLQQTAEIVEVRINSYRDDTTKSELAKACFMQLCTNTLVRMQGRLLAADGIMTANPTTTRSKYAAYAGQALNVVAGVSAMPGADMLPILYNIGYKYVTGKYAKGQNDSVRSASIIVNLPLLLVELSEATTEMIVTVAKEKKLSDDDIDLLVIKTAKAINSKIESLNSYIAKHDNSITKESLSELLSDAVIKTITEFVKIKATPGHMHGYIRHSGSTVSHPDSLAGSNVSHLDSPGSSTVSNPDSPGRTPDPKSRRKDKGCNIS